MGNFKLEHIKQGILNAMRNELGVLDEDISKLANGRTEICNSCSHKTELNTCKLCGCFLPFKTKVLEAKCDDGKW